MRAFGLLLGDLAARVALPPPPSSGLLARLGAALSLPRACGNGSRHASQPGASPAASSTHGNGSHATPMAASNGQTDANRRPHAPGFKGGGGEMVLSGYCAAVGGEGTHAACLTDSNKLQLALAALAGDCTQPAASARPSFAAIAAWLASPAELLAR